MSIFYQYTRMVEPLSLDEAFLDVTENSMKNPSATRVASVIREHIYKDTGLTASAGVSYNKMKMNVFNPGSRAHIANRLMTIRGWQPSEFTGNGQPKVDDTILSSLPYPEAQQIAYYLMLQKRIGQVYEGRNSWINKYNHEWLDI